MLNTSTNEDRKIRAIIVEDEVLGRDNLKNLLAMYCPNLEVIGEAESIEHGLALITRPEIQPIDVAFLDINLPDGLVFQLLDEARFRIKDIIFVTGYDKFAIRACSYASIGYIVKPIDPIELRNAVARIRQGNQGIQPEQLDVFKDAVQKSGIPEKLVINSMNGMVFVKPSDIVRIEGDDNYSNIYLKDRNDKIVVAKTIKHYESILCNNSNFFRVHKSHIVNLDHMVKYLRGDGGEVILSDGTRIPVSRRRRNDFLEYLKD